MRISFRLLLFLGICGFLFFKCGALSRGSDSLNSQRKGIVSFAQKHKGTPYKYAGKNPRGFDCSGFTYFVMGQHDVALSASSAAQAKQGKKIGLRDAQAGDLVFFSRKKGGRIFHVAIISRVDRNGIYIIHSTSSRGVVEDHLNSSKYWWPKVAFVRDVLN